MTAFRGSHFNLILRVVCLVFDGWPRGSLHFGRHPVKKELPLNVRQLHHVRALAKHLLGGLRGLANRSQARGGGPCHGAEGRLMKNISECGMMVVDPQFNTDTYLRIDHAGQDLLLGALVALGLT